MSCNLSCELFSRVYSMKLSSEAILAYWRAYWRTIIYSIGINIYIVRLLAYNIHSGKRYTPGLSSVLYKWTRQEQTELLIIHWAMTVRRLVQGAGGTAARPWCDPWKISWKRIYRRLRRSWFDKNSVDVDSKPFKAVRQVKVDTRRRQKAYKYIQ